MNARIPLLAALLLALTTLSACGVLQSRSVKEFFKLAGKDGDRRLRDPMRPIRGETRVLVFALDGVGHDAFVAAVRAGRMPETQRLLGAETDDAGVFAHAYAAPDVLSVLPSSTTAAWVAAFTGEGPARTGVPGNEWFDRSTMRFHAPTPVTTERKYQVLQSYTEDVLGASIRVPTLYERAAVRSHVSLLNVYTGADLLNIPEVEPFGTLFNAALNEAAGADSARHRFYEQLDRISIASLEESLGRYGFADLQTVYLPGADLFTHISASALDEQQGYLERVVDAAIGRVLALYRDEGLLDDTYVLFVSDHGQTAVRPEPHNALWREGDDEPPALLQRTGFRVRPWGLETDREDGDFQAAFAYQGGMAFIYLADRSTCPEAGTACDWRRPARLEEDVLAAARAFDEADRTGRHVPALQGTLDLILARRGAAPGVDAPAFQVYDGGRLVPLGDYLERHPRPDLLDLERRLDDLATGEHGHLAGDILLLSRMRLDAPVAERTYFGEAFHSWHGSPNAADGRIIFTLAQPAASGASLRRMMHDALGPAPRQQDATRLILHVLNL